jgi:hypothetical protein
VTGAILSLALAYACLLLVLLLLLFRSEIRVSIKFAALALSCAFYVWHFQALQSFVGWPAESRLPENFQLISSYTIEPNEQNDQPGGIYLWVRDLDSDDPTPRSFRLAYDRQVHQEVDSAVKQQQQGNRLVGKPSYSGGGKTPQIEFDQVQRDIRQRKAPLEN